MSYGDSKYLRDNNDNDKYDLTQYRDDKTQYGDQGNVLNQNVSNYLQANEYGDDPYAETQQIVDNALNLVASNVSLQQMEKYFEKASFPNVEIVYLKDSKNNLEDRGEHVIGEHGIDERMEIDSPEVPSNVANGSELFKQFKKVLRQTDILLAHAAKFLPESMLANFAEQYNVAANEADLLVPENTQKAIDQLHQLQKDLAKASSPKAGHEGKVLRQQIGERLTNGEQTLLSEGQLQRFTQTFKTLDIDNHTDAEQQVEELRTLYFDLDNALDDQLKAISDLMVDLEQLQPFVDRAIKIYEAGEMSLEKDNLQSKMDLLAKGQIKGLEAMRQTLREVQSEVKQLLQAITLDEKKELQMEAMPVPPKELKVGQVLGKGAFGEVVLLQSSSGVRLAGKCFDPKNQDGAKEMLHEEEIYAKLGEHPNIAKCYGIHEIDGKSMLVMEEIAGGDLNDVFSKMESDFRNQKTSRSEFLGGMQQLIKGTLQGLAHFEELGLVHKDIKGNNIRFDNKTNRAVIVDMGLGQEVSNKHENIKSYVPNAPPEQFTMRVTENRISNLWDSFSLGKMLFPLMEQDKNSTDKYQFLPGENPRKAKMDDKGGSWDPVDMKPLDFTKSNLGVYVRGEDGKPVPRTDNDGNITGVALKRTKTPGDVKVGEYDVLSAYVDFMVHLTHPDPKWRLSPLDALKHPFMTQSLIDEKLLYKVFGTEPPAPKIEGDDENQLNYADVNQWDEIRGKPNDTDENQLNYTDVNQWDEIRAKPNVIDEKEIEKAIERYGLDQSEPENNYTADSNDIEKLLTRNDDSDDEEEQLG